MPGQPLPIDDQTFSPIYILIYGNGNIGKSTVANAIKSNTTLVIHTDLWVTEFFGDKCPKNLGIALMKMKDKTKLTTLLIKNILLLPKTYKIYVIEGHVLAYKEVIEVVKKELKSKHVWVMSK
jgi:GTPase SAR1 family protein